jgi:hypothetical protein
MEGVLILYCCMSFYIQTCMIAPAVMEVVYFRIGLRPPRLMNSDKYKLLSAFLTIGQNKIPPIPVLTIIKQAVRYLNSAQ